MACPLRLAGALLCAAFLLPAHPKAAPARKVPPRPAAASSANLPQQWLRSLSLRDRVAQLIMVPFYGENPHVRSRAFRDYARFVRDLHVGGMIILNRVRGGLVQRAEPFAMTAFINRMQRISKLPLMIGGDFERGASMRLTGAAPFPHLMAFGAANDLAATRAFGLASAREARALGVQWIFTPVADVNNNPANPVIGLRSFGEDPNLVAAHVKAYIEGARSDPAARVLLSVKHFPGHGDTAVDSHYGLPVITASAERLQQLEFVPFRAAIAAGVDSVMSAHLNVPALEPDNVPGTVSRRIMTGILKEELGFQGLLTTDAMDMQGLTKMFPPGEAAVRALEAGIDLLLIPKDPYAAVDGVLAAIKSGRLTEKRINESVLKLLQAKVKVGLHRKRIVPLDDLAEAIDSPEDQELAGRVAEKALSLVKNENQVLPLARNTKACFLVVTGVRGTPLGREFADEIRARTPAARVINIDPQVSAADLDQIAAGLAPCEKVVAANFANGPWLGHVPAFFEKILAQKPPVVLVSLSNPYLLASFPQVAAYLATYSTSAASESAAVRALYGEVPATARPPVTLVPPAQ